MIMNINEQIKKVLDEIDRNVSSGMVFKLDDLVSYNISKRASNFKTFNSILQSKILFFAFSYDIFNNLYRKK